MFFAIMLACQQDVLSEYQKSLAPVHETITKAPQNWKPDIMIRLNYNKISEILKPILQASIGKGKFTYSVLGSPIQININNQIKGLTISNAKNNTLKLKMDLEGFSKWKAFGRTSKIPYQGSISLRVNLLFQDEQVKVKILNVSSVDIEINNSMIDLSKPFQSWIRDELKKQKPYSVLEVDLEQLPLLDFRVTSSKNAAHIESISKYDHGQYLSPSNEPLSRDFELRASNGLVDTMLRLGGIELGQPVDGVYVDPYHLSILNEELSILVRLWKTEGLMQGMRSYDVQGSYGIANNRVAVKLDDFTTLEESIGYGKFNPILLIGENFIEKKVLERIQPVFPSSHGTQFQKYRLEGQLQSIESNEEELSIHGNIVVKEKKKR